MSMTGTPSSIAASSPAAGTAAGAAEAKAPKPTQLQSMDLEFIIDRWCFFYGKLETPRKNPGQLEWYALNSSELETHSHVSQEHITNAKNHPWLQRDVVPHPATPISTQTSPERIITSETYTPPANQSAQARSDTEEHKWTDTTTHRADYQHSLTRRRQIKTSSEIKLESAPVAFSAAIEAAWTNTTADAKTDAHIAINHHEVKRSVPVEIPPYSQCTVTHTLTQQEETRTYQSQISLSGKLMVCANLMSYFPRRGLFLGIDGKWHRKKLVSIRELFNDFDRWQNHAALNTDELNTIASILNTTTRPDGTDTVVCQSTQTVVTTIKKERIDPTFSLLPNAPTTMPAAA